MLTLQESIDPVPRGRRLALVIGVNGAVATTAYLASLSAAERGAETMAQVLHDICDFELLGLPLLGEQATTEAVKKAIRTLARQRTANDTLLCYFAGHGYPLADAAAQQDICLVTHDFDPAEYEEFGDEHAVLSLQWLSQIFNESTKAGRVVLILDCCYGGNMSALARDRPLDTAFKAFKRYLVDASRKSHGTRATLAAAAQDATAWEYDGNSIMTYHLLEALQGQDDYLDAIDEAGQITLERLQDVLRKKMPPDQKLSFSGEVIGESLVLATHLHLSAQARRLAAHAEREQWLRALAVDHSGFLQDRLDNFVGRKQELAEVRQQIEALLPTGGFLTITGEPGQGKSSMIAKLIESYSREQGGLEYTAYHFIPPTPPPDHQVALLRKLMTRLILKYELPEFYVASESRATLSETFPTLLKAVVANGGQEIIFIDGLDQLPVEPTGQRDLSFLPQGPENPPPGIVFVLGTRPNDTLRSLELLKFHRQYPLRKLSRNDFDLLLRYRGVVLERTLADQCYLTLQANALYLGLLAKELAVRGSLLPSEIDEIIKHISDDPSTVFSLTIERLKQPAYAWERVLKPILGLLLVASEPLGREQLKHLLNIYPGEQITSEHLNDGLRRLSDFITTDAQHRFTLFHLKLYDFLRPPPEHTTKASLFDVEDERNLHQHFIAWCEQGGLEGIWHDTSEATEQARRSYARQHYIPHLYHAHDWSKLFAVLDEGVYGKAKIQHDPSMQSYALDLDWGRQAAASTYWSRQEAIKKLPYLWKYTLLRCSLASRADNYPIAAFELMLLLGQETKAMGLASLMTDISRKVEMLLLIAKHMTKQPEREREAWQMWQEAERVISSIPEERNRAYALSQLATALAQVQNWEEAERVIASITDELYQATALSKLAFTLAQAQLWQEAEQVVASIPEWISSSYFGSNNTNRSEALRKLGIALVQAQRWQDAERVFNRIYFENERAEALRELGTALVQAQREPEALRIWREAERVGSPPGRATALSKLGTALAQANYWQEAERVWQVAEQVITSLKDEWSRETALRELSIAFAQAKRWQEAERVITSIADEGKRTYALQKLGVALAQAQRRQDAERIWHGIERVILSISDELKRSEALSSLWSAFMEAQHWQEAERIISSFPYWGQQMGALRKLATALVQAQHWQEAERIISSLPIDPINYEMDRRETPQPEALMELGTALAQAQQWHEAERVWREAERVICVLSNEIDPEILSRLGLAFARAQRWQDVDRIWREAERVISSFDQEGQAKTLHELGLALAQAQRWQEAEQVITSIAAKAERAEAFGKLGTLLAQAQNSREAERVWQKAEQVIASIADEWDHAMALQELGMAFAQVQRWQKAEQLIASIVDNKRRMDAMKQLGITYAQAQRWPEAKRIITSLTDKWAQGWVLEALCISYARAKHWQEAERVIADLPNENYSNKALMELSTTLAQAHQWQDAKRIIASIPYKVARSISLGKLGIAFAQNQQWQEAKRVWQETEQVIASITDWLPHQMLALKELSTAYVEVQYWQEARRIIASISIPEEQAQALRELSIAYAQLQRWQEAEVVWQEAEQLNSIAKDYNGVDLLHRLIMAYAKGRRWQEARRTAASIPVDDYKRDVAALKLGEVFAQYHEHEQLLHLVQQEWQRATTRDTALGRLALAFGLLPLAPDIGIAFCDAFAWVDHFLRG